jgi:glycerate 2-kinase
LGDITVYFVIIRIQIVWYKNFKMNYRSVAEQIFLAGVDRVLPGRLINKSISIDDNILAVGNHRFNLKEYDNIYIIGAGKASALMGAEVERIFSGRITDGHIAVKYGHSCRLEKIKVTEAGHPVPDSNSFAATKSILEIAAMAGNKDLVICLLSGGGSALLSDCPEGISQEEMAGFNRLMVNSGASIGEINAVRKHLSGVKGGQLARAVYPATLISLILSDVINDPLDVIASGPTVPDPTTFGQALEVLSKYDLEDSVVPAIIDHLTHGKSGDIPETPKAEDPVFKRTYNILAGNNKLALEASAERAAGFDLKALILDDKLEGDVNMIFRFIVDTALEYQKDPAMSKPVSLLLGGEPTVKVSGKGEGGRNQHLALLCSLLLKDHQGITILSAGTDGNDGPTPAAGAVVDCDTYNNAVAQNISPYGYLAEFDSFNFFRKAGGHIITGPTMTNVMDIIVIIVE